MQGRTSADDHRSTAAGERATGRSGSARRSASPAGSPMTYAAAGVDIESGDQVVPMIRHLLRRTHGPRVLGRHGAFAGMFRLDYNEKLFRRNYREPVLVACTDGVGTKVKLAARLDALDGIGIDLVAMNVNDLIVQGAEPLFFLDYIGMHRQVPDQTVRIIRGVARGCEIAGCALIGGECAEMPDVYAEGDFDLAGFAVGVVELHRAIEPMRVRPGDRIVALASSGVHSNGYSLVRRIIDDRGLDVEAVLPVLGEHDEDRRTLGEHLIEPTRIYAEPIVRLLRRYRVKKVVSAMAHITGGGLPGNVNRALPEDVDAVIDRSTWTIPPLFTLLRTAGDVDPAEMDRVFNLGVGYVLIVRPTFAESVVRRLTALGERAWLAGEIVEGGGRVKLTGRRRWG